MTQTIRFGIIGCGLMGREFASAAARWCHLTEEIARPEIVGVCDTNEQARGWFVRNFPSVKYSVDDYHELLARPDIDAIYCALPHVLHEKVYTDIICAGKHLLGEKPFGIDKAANDAIMAAIAAHREERFGKIIEVRSSFCHSSDMDPNKPINWKRKIEINGEYGCMGDLGIHTQHVPFRMGWTPLNVYAKLSKIIDTRPDGKGGTAPCLTWDNALLVSDVRDKDGKTFPMLMRTMRLDPGATDRWSLEVYGLKASARFSTDDPGAFYYTDAWEKEQAWCRLGIGYKPMIPTITGGIFEFGFTDAILQMWAAFLCELTGKDVPFGCMRPEETALSHKLQTAALISHKEARVVTID